MVGGTIIPYARLNHRSSQIMRLRRSSATGGILRFTPAAKGTQLLTATLRDTKKARVPYLWIEINNIDMSIKV